MGKAVADALIEISVGTPLLLIREPDNPYDTNAIRVMTVIGRSIGYVQREVAAIVAPKIDAGHIFLGKITRASRLLGIERTNGRMVVNMSYPWAVLWLDPPREEETSKPERAKEDA